MNASQWRRVALALLAAVVALLIYNANPRRLLFHTLADPPAVLREVKQLRELVTVRYAIQKVTGIREDKVPVGSESILLIVQAHVLGGIDLDELREGDIHVQSGRKVEIKLPPAKILHVEVDEKNTKVWDRTKTWWTPWVPYDIDLEKNARLQAISELRGEAIEMGILLDAQINAQTLIRGLLKPLGFDQVSFQATHS